MIFIRKGNEMNNTIEKQIILAYEDDLIKKANTLIEQRVEMFRDELIVKSNEIISVILNNVLITQNQDPVSLRTVIQIQLANILIRK
jgi:hypothetical protein